MAAAWPRILSCLISGRHVRIRLHRLRPAVNGKPPRSLLRLRPDRALTGAHYFIGGTGKYKGISGTAPFTVESLPAPDEGLGALIIPHEVTWKLE
jgi:hypothetical protein